MASRDFQGNEEAQVYRLLGMQLDGFAKVTSSLMPRDDGVPSRRDSGKMEASIGAGAGSPAIGCDHNGRAHVWMKMAADHHQARHRKSNGSRFILRIAAQVKRSGARKRKYVVEDYIPIWKRDRGSGRHDQKIVLELPPTLFKDGGDGVGRLQRTIKVNDHMIALEIERVAGGLLP